MLDRKLRIFLIGGPVRPDYMEKHVLMALHGMGHDVRAFNAREYVPGGVPGSGLLNRAASRIWREPERLFERRILREVEAWQPDLVLELLGNLVSPKTIALMRKRTNAQFVCWCQDQMTTLGRQYLIGADFDRIFMKDWYLVENFRDMLGLPVQYLAEACNPAIHRSVQPTAEEAAYYGADICTYGNLYYYRQRILGHLVKYRLKVWGNVPNWLDLNLGPAVMRKSIFEDEKCKAIASSAILLNTLHFGEMRSLNARAFEGSACGGFQLITHSPVVADHFVPGEEVAVFDNLADLLEKVDHYLHRPEERHQIAAAGQRRCHRDHTFEQRVKHIIDHSFGTG